MTKNLGADMLIYQKHHYQVLNSRVRANPKLDVKLPPIAASSSASAINLRTSKSKSLKSQNSGDHNL